MSGFFSRRLNKGKKRDSEEVDSSLLMEHPRVKITRVNESAMDVDFSNFNNNQQTFSLTPSPSSPSPSPSYPTYPMFNNYSMFNNQQQLTQLNYFSQEP